MELRAWYHSVPRSMNESKGVIFYKEKAFGRIGIAEN